MSGTARLPTSDKDARDHAVNFPVRVGSNVQSFLRWFRRSVKENLGLGADAISASPGVSAPNPDYGVWVTLSSSRIYYLKHGIYVAYPLGVPVPAKALSFYEKNIKANLLPQLEVAFKAVEQAACRSGSTIDWVSERVSLQMLDKDTDRDGTNIKLSPRICVRCPRRQKQYMEDVLRDYSLDWISRSGFGPIMVLTAAELSGSNYAPSARELGNESAPTSARVEAESEGGLSVLGVRKSLVVQLHIGVPEDAESLHGAYCRALITHEGRILAQRYSRIGGLVDIGSEILGITTAHHLLDGFWDEMTDHDHVDEPEGQSISHGETKPTTGDGDFTVISDNHKDEDSSEDDYEPLYQKRVHPVHTRDPTKITNWTRVQLHLGTSFSTVAMVSLNKKWTIMFRMGPEDVFSDFALVRLPANWVATNFLNITSHPALAPSISPSTEDESSEGMTMPVCILLGVDGTIEGTLEPGYRKLMVRGQPFTTRVIQLGQTSLPRGSSGAWVMCAHGMCGMIVASSQSEPLAYMIAADRLQEDLQQVSRSANQQNGDLRFRHPVGLRLPVMARHQRRSSSPPPPDSLEVHAPGNASASRRWYMPFTVGFSHLRRPRPSSGDTSDDHNSGGSGLREAELSPLEIGANTRDDLSLSSAFLRRLAQSDWLTMTSGPRVVRLQTARYSATLQREPEGRLGVDEESARVERGSS